MIFPDFAIASLLVVIRVARVCLIKLEFALISRFDKQKKIQKKKKSVFVTCKRKIQKIKKKKKKVKCLIEKQSSTIVKSLASRLLKQLGQ